MGTHCMIAIEDKDGSVRYIFCHYNGFPAHMVPLLKKHYMTREGVNHLLSEGGIVSLEDGIMDRHESRMEWAKDRQAFMSEWRMTLSVPYLYIFTQDDEWLCCCNRNMPIHEILP